MCSKLPADNVKLTLVVKIEHIEVKIVVLCSF